MKPAVTARPTAANPFPLAPQFRETPLPPPTRPKRKRLPPPIGKEERLQLIREARAQIDEAELVLGCMARQAHEMRSAIGAYASVRGEHFLVALKAMADAGGENLKVARAKLNSLESIVMYGTYGAPVAI